jgi:hypothetical protein
MLDATADTAIAKHLSSGYSVLKNIPSAIAEESIREVIHSHP